MPAYGDVREDGFRFRGYRKEGSGESWISPQAWEAKRVRQAAWRAANYAANITEERAKAATYMQGYRRTQPELHMLVRARCRAKAQGLAFTITLLDLFVPEFCPVLGIRLEVGSEDRDCYPSIDRIENSKGYEPGNILIVSQRANRIKSDATITELELLAHFYGAIAEDRLPVLY